MSVAIDLPIWLIGEVDTASDGSGIDRLANKIARLQLYPDAVSARYRGTTSGHGITKVRIEWPRLK